jgi:hypothetical protein
MTNQIINIFWYAIPILTTFLLAGLLADTIESRLFHKRIHKLLKQQALTNGAFNSEELMLEADKLMHDDKESDNARDFAKRVYIIGRTARAAQEEEE